MNEFLQFTFDKITSYLGENDDNEKPVVKYKLPSELAEIIDFKIPENGVSKEEFFNDINLYLDYSVRTGNKQFLNQLYAGFNLPAFIGEVFTVLANTSMYTYEVAPVATSIEKEMVQLMSSYAGYSDGDGIFVSGGSNANLVAMFSARNRIFPEGRFEGYNSNLKLTAFVNEQAHYSFETAANVMGIGSNNVKKVKADKNGRIIPQELEKEIKESIKRGEKPFFVAATCATTLLGAYDPIDEMAEISKKYNLWLHADGSFGGSLIISPKYRHFFKGIEKTDSFAWNPHKLMNIPLICSVLLVNDKTTLYKNLTELNTDYIFHDIDAVEDLGKKSIQCGRRVDAVKLWFAWKYYGKKGYEQQIENAFEMAAYAEECVKNNPNMELLARRQSFTVCFRYIPKLKYDVNDFNLKVREKLRKSGKSIVNYGYIGKVLAIRLIIANNEITKKDVDLFFQNFLEIAEETIKNDQTI